MIARLAGTLLDRHVQRIVVDVAGVGYDVQVPLSTLYAVGEVGAPVTLRIHTHVREDALQLFGFATPLEQTLFERLISVSGIGPKLALAVLSGIEPAGLVSAIRDGDVARLTRVPGIGKRTAERMVVELRDRMAEAPGAEVPAAGDAPASIRADLLSALVNLGYPLQTVEKRVDAALRDEETADLQTVLRQILRELSRA